MTQPEPLGDTELWFSDATSPDVPVQVVYDADGVPRLVPYEAER